MVLLCPTPYSFMFIATANFLNHITVFHYLFIYIIFACLNVLIKDCVLQFDVRALNQSLKEQEAKKAADTKPVVAEAPKIIGSGDDQDGEGDDDDESDLDIDNM